MDRSSSLSRAVGLGKLTRVSTEYTSPRASSTGNRQQRASVPQQEYCLDIAKKLGLVAEPPAVSGTKALASAFIACFKQPGGGDRGQLVRLANAEGLADPEALDDNALRDALVESWRATEIQRRKTSGSELWHTMVAYWLQALRNGAPSALGERFRDISDVPTALRAGVVGDWKLQGITELYLSFVAHPQRNARVPVPVFEAPFDVDGNGTLHPPSNPDPASGPVLPRFNVPYLDPRNEPLEPETVVIGSKQKHEEFVKGDRYREKWESWQDYLGYLEDFWATVMGTLAFNGETPEHCSWGIYRHQAGRATAAIENVYDRLLSRSDIAEFPVLAKILACQPSACPIARDDIWRGSNDNFGHMDDARLPGEVGDRTRSGKPLDRSQRRALAAVALTRQGIQAVTGPPGTGKTTFLRSAIAREWVAPLLTEAPDPSPRLVVATAATNQAVRNVIASFDGIASNTAGIASRWIGNVASYGWYLPSRTQMDGQANDHLSQFQMLDTRRGPSGRAAALTESIQDVDGLTHAYVKAAQSALGTTTTPGALDTTERVCEGLRHLVTRAVAELRSLSTQLEKLIRGEESLIPLPLLHQRSLLVKEELQTCVEQHEAWTARLGEANQRCAEVQSALDQWHNAGVLRKRANRWPPLLTLSNLWCRLRRSRNVGEELAIALHSASTHTAALGWPGPPVAPEKWLEWHDNQIAQSRSEIVSQIEALQNQKTDLKSQWSHLLTDARMWENAKRLRSEFGQLLRGAGKWSFGLLEPMDPNPLDRFVSGLLGDTTGGWLECTPLDDDVWFHWQEYADLAWRAPIFHLTARYWEGRFVQRLNLDRSAENHDESGGELELRKWAMLGPCFVMTAHHLPNRLRRFADTDGCVDLLIVDEASQASPDILGAAMAFCTRAVVLGDDLQLPPIHSIDGPSDDRLQHRFALDQADPGFVRAGSAATGSLMAMAIRASSWVDEAGGPGVMLRQHYRCLPQIIEFNNKYVYRGALEAKRDPGSVGPLPPMSWVECAQWHVPGPNKRKKFEEQQSDGSRRNDAEAAELAHWVATEAGRLEAHYGKPVSEIVAVITPFRAQARRIETELQRSLGAQANGMIVGTVHSLQGAEREVVALSLVNTECSDVLFMDREGPNLLNVAISRAKDSFIVFAHPKVLFRPRAEKTTSGQLAEYLRTVGRRLYPELVVVVESSGKAEAIENVDGLRSVCFATDGHFRGIDPSGPTLADAFGAARPDMTALSTLKAEMFDALVTLLTTPARGTILIATDDDREGEAIGWHVLDVLRISGVTFPPCRMRRARFVSFSDAEIRSTLDNLEELDSTIDIGRTKAALARAAFDRVLPSYMRETRGISIGRLQGAILDIVRRAEEERIRAGTAVNARVRTAGGQMASGWLAAKEGEAYEILGTDHEAALRLARSLRAAELPPPQVSSTERSLWTLGPSTTAVVLAEAARDLGLAPQRTAEILEALWLGHWPGEA